MYELRPLLQLRKVDGKPSLADLLIGETFTIDNSSMLAMLAIIAEEGSNRLEEHIEIISKRLGLPQIEAQGAVDALVETGIVVKTETITSQKAGVQSWVDKGWTDALILHFSSRNLKYYDDPETFGGSDEVSRIPELSDKSEANEDDLIFLSQPKVTPEAEEVLSGIMNRRSFKPFIRKGFSEGELESILWFSNSYARERAILLERGAYDGSRDKVYDSAFSALSSYLVLYKDVEISGTRLSKGLYRYTENAHALALVKEGDFRADIAKLAIGQRRISSGVYTIIICGNWREYHQRYPHERSYRNLLVNTAQLAQFYLVLSTMNSFNTFMTPAMYDENMSRFLDLEQEFPLYMVSGG